MSYEDRKTYLTNNPDIVAHMTPPNFVSGVSGVTHKTDGGFKDLMSRIADANPYSRVGHEYGRKGIKETANREAVERQKQRQTT